jgi:tRNA pseudouridine55 synthase
MENFRDPESYINGRVLMIDKEIDWTSFDVVNKIRRSLKVHVGIPKIKVGHAGTLDPLATGLVIVCTGRFTKQIQQYQDLSKTYEATFRFGETTPSFDLETAVDKTYPWEHIDRREFDKAAERFNGEIEQIPPIYSAKKIDGKRAYDIARQGKTIELKPSTVNIYSIEVTSFNMPEVKLIISCSKGTYIRSLARDFGESLASGAHLTALRRLKIGDFDVNEAMTLKSFEKKLKQL